MKRFEYTMQKDEDIDGIINVSSVQDDVGHENMKKTPNNLLRLYCNKIDLWKSSLLVIAILLVVCVFNLTIEVHKFAVDDSDEDSSMISYQPIINDENNPIRDGSSVLLVDSTKINQNELFLQIPSSFTASDDGDFLFIEQVTHGVGLRSLAWDPSSFVTQSHVSFQTSNNFKINLKAANTNYNGDWVTIHKSFSQSVIHSFPIIKQYAKSVIIDIKELAFSSPAWTIGHDLPITIKENFGIQHNYILDIGRSAIDFKNSKSNNYEIVIVSNISYILDTSSTPPYLMKKSLAVPAVITLTIRRTLLNLREYSMSIGSFKPRFYHPKSGFNQVSFMDEKSSLLESRLKLYVVKHNLNVINKDKSKQPSSNCLIKYKLDNNTPEPIRSALLEGISWWDEAFQFAGFPKNSFQVEIAESNYDSYDFKPQREHFVEWIDRDYRFYSMGRRVVNMKTGEILKGHVLIESLRMRHDALIAEALLGPFDDFDPFVSTSPQRNDDNSLVNNIYDAILQRVHQLGAHEVGHTLGLSHNFAGSTYSNGYGSVMDYPPPIVTLDTTKSYLILNNQSYGNGIGFFDKIAISYAYKNFGNISDADEISSLFKLIANAENQGYVYLTDEDSALYESDWRDTPWDFGNNPIKSLNHTLQVRSLALKKLSERSIPFHSPISKLRELFPLIYFWHRYEIDATAKMIGGINYQYSMKGDIYNLHTSIIPSAWQKKALEQLLFALKPNQLAIPSNLIMNLVPQAFGYHTDIGDIDDLIPTRTGNNFDPIISYEIISNYIISSILQNERIERLANQYHYNNSLPHLQEILEIISDSILMDYNNCMYLNDYLLEIITIQAVLINKYLEISSNLSKITSYLVNSIFKSHLKRLLSPSSGIMKQIICEQNIVNKYNIDMYNNNTQILKAHIEQGKPFMIFHTLPTGSPI
eukprot:gene12908-17298_t